MQNVNMTEQRLLTALIPSCSHVSPHSQQGALQLPENMEHFNPHIISILYSFSFTVLLLQLLSFPPFFKILFI